MAEANSEVGPGLQIGEETNGQQHLALPGVSEIKLQTPSPKSAQTNPKRQSTLLKSNETAASSVAIRRQNVQPATKVASLSSSVSAKPSTAPPLSAASAKTKSTTSSTPTKTPDSAPPLRAPVSGTSRISQSKPPQIRSTVVSPSPSTSLARPALVQTKARTSLSPGSLVQKSSPSSRPAASVATKVTPAVKLKNISSGDSASKKDEQGSPHKDGNIVGPTEPLKRVAELEAQLQELTATLDSTLKELNESNTKYQDELSNRLSQQGAAVTEKAALTLQLARVETESDALKANVDIQEQTILDLRSQLLALSNDHQVSSSASENLAVQLAQELSNAKLQREAALEQLESFRQAVAALETERLVLIETKTTLEATISEKDGILASNSSQLRDALSLGEELKLQLEPIPSLQVKIQSLNIEKDAQQHKISELEVEILETREELEKLQESSAIQSEKLRHAQEELASSSMLYDEVAANALAKSDAYSSELERERTAHEKQLEEVKVARGLTTARLEEVQKRLGIVEKERDEVRQQLTRLEADHSSAMENTKRQYQEMLDAAQTRFQVAEAEYHRTSAAFREQQEQAIGEARDAARGEAAASHSKELQLLRAQSQASIQELRASHDLAIEQSRLTHKVESDRLVHDWEKRLSSQSLELKATREDLLKAKAALPAVQDELKSLKVELQKAHEAAASTVDAQKHDDEVRKLAEELARTKDALHSNQLLHSTCAETLDSLAGRHTKELEHNAINHVSALAKLQQEYENENGALQGQISSLQHNIRELEIERAELLAKADALRDAALPTIPQTNGVVSSPQVITREELSRMHEAHNLKIHELEAEHAKTIADLEGALTVAVKRADELETTAERTGMEMHFLRSEGEENADRIKRLEEELANYRTRLASIDP